MDENELEILCKAENLEEISIILHIFLKKNENAFNFPSLAETNNRILLWTGIFQHLGNESSSAIHALCLACVRVLSRDKSELDSLICLKWIDTLIERAGLTSTYEIPDKDVVVEALKCLYNLTYNSEVARELCVGTKLAEGLVARTKTYRQLPFRNEIMLYDMKLMFILTALRQDIKLQIKNKFNGMDNLINCMEEMISEADSVNNQVPGTSVLDDKIDYYFLEDFKQTIICEILRTQFNLIMQCTEDSLDENEEVMFKRLIPVLARLLYANTSNEANLMELRSNIANLLTSVQSKFYSDLTPPLNEGEKAVYVFDGLKMDALHALLQLLQYRLTVTTNTQNQYENLSPILTVLNKSVHGCRAQRKYLRQVVLPPLRDVSLPPEKGNTLRNQLCRLLTTPVTSIRDLVAEFLFVLCKEKVGRFVKYTGFGNAAGHLAQKGLLGAESGAVYSSSSDDSDTEEYLEAQPHIDPVVGCARPPRINPFEGMTEEQKEYEAMKLVNLFDKMVTAGVVKPARVGPDGRPQPIEHVLEMRENPPNRTQS